MFHGLFLCLLLAATVAEDFHLASVEVLTAFCAAKDGRIANNKCFFVPLSGDQPTKTTWTTIWSECTKNDATLAHIYDASEYSAVRGMST
jgi:hypothetical protein